VVDCAMRAEFVWKQYQIHAGSEEESNDDTPGDQPIRVQQEEYGARLVAVQANK